MCVWFFSPEQSRWRCTIGTEMAGECDCNLQLNKYELKRELSLRLKFFRNISDNLSQSSILSPTSVLLFVPDIFFSLFIPFPSHDFIGDFTTSYRELARGQSQFNVYEVSNASVFIVQQHVCRLLRSGIPSTRHVLDLISDTSDISVPDITVALFPLLQHIPPHLHILRQNNTFIQELQKTCRKSYSIHLYGTVFVHFSPPPTSSYTSN